MSTSENVFRKWLADNRSYFVFNYPYNFKGNDQIVLASSYSSSVSRTLDSEFEKGFLYVVGTTVKKYGAEAILVNRSCRVILMCDRLNIRSGVNLEFVKSQLKRLEDATAKLDCSKIYIPWLLCDSIPQWYEKNSWETENQSLTVDESVDLLRQCLGHNPKFEWDEKPTII